MSQLVDDYLAVGDYNVFSVDWGHFNGDKVVHYLQAVPAVRPGRGARRQPRSAVRGLGCVDGVHCVAAVVLLAETQGGSVVRRLHLVGHSLGAHLVGFLAKQVQKLGLGKVARITALDPAGPLFRLKVSLIPASRGPLLLSWPREPGGGLTGQTRTSCRSSTATPGAWAWR